MAPADTGVQIPTPGVQEAGLRNKPKNIMGSKAAIEKKARAEAKIKAVEQKKM